MKKVIVDMQMAESYSLGLGAETDSSGKVTRYNKNKDSLYVFYSAILKHYHLSFEAFNQAINWYKNHPENMDSLLNHSVEELNREKARLGIATSAPERESNLDEPEAAPGFRQLEIDRRHSDSAGKLSTLHHPDTAGHQKNSVEKR